MMREDQAYHGVRDAFAPPGRQPYGDAARRAAKDPSAGAPKSRLLEDDALSLTAAPNPRDVAGNDATIGSLVIVDTGVMAVSQVTVEGRHWIEQSDRVLFLGADPVTEHWIRSLNENLESLNRLETSDEIVERTLDHVRRGLAVCLAVHGRSRLSAEVLSLAIGQGRAEGFAATVVPGVSALDCLFADLGVDPTRTDCQIFGAEAFLQRRRRPDLASALVLFVSDDVAIGELLERLRSTYGAEHEGVLYEPPQYAVLEPMIRRCAIGNIDQAELEQASIIFVPPKDIDG